MGFAIDKAYINEDNETINIVVNKVGDTVLATKANLTRSYNHVLLLCTCIGSGDWPTCTCTCTCMYLQWSGYQIHLKESYKTIVSCAYYM